jgi:hypothetical protein
MARTMLKESKLLDIFWREEVHTAIHILNIDQLKVNGEKIPYHLWKGRPTIVKHFKAFIGKYYIKREEEYLGTLQLNVQLTRVQQIMTIG